MTRSVTRLCVAFCAVMLGLSIAQAAEGPTLIVSETGYYLVQKSSTGEPVLVKITSVIVLGENPDNPLPPPETNVAKQVRQWAQEVNHPVGAQALAEVYDTIAEKVEKGEVPKGSAFDVVKEATNQVLSVPTINGMEKWAGWRAKVGDLVIPRLQNGELDTADQIAVFLRQVADGLQGSVAEAPALDPAILALIVRIVLAIIERLFGGGGGGIDIPGPV